MGGFIIYVGFRVIKLFNDVSVQLHENIADVLKGLRVYYLYIQSSNQCEVSHEMAAELAHAIATEVNQCFGGEAILRLTSSDIIKGMSTAFSTGHSALGTRKAIAEAGEATLHLNIPVTTLEIGLQREHPAILFSSYVKTLGDLGKLDVLHANADLGKFWETLQPLRPGHPVYSLPKEEWDHVIPIYLIADEGRGLRHSAVMVLGCEPLLGNGCETQDENTAQEPFKMNFTGNTYRTRQLFSVLHRPNYKKGEAALHQLVAHWSENLRLCFDGIQVSGTLWRVAVLGLKGDLPALDKLGRLTRHFRREAYPHGRGLCHLCMCNTSVCPQWHQHRFDTAPWVQTMATATNPWISTKESSLTATIPIDRNLKARFFLPDLFHTVHKGVHADLTASAIEPWPWQIFGACSNTLNSGL